MIYTTQIPSVCLLRMQPLSASVVLLVSMFCVCVFLSTSSCSDDGESDTKSEQDISNLVYQCLDQEQRDYDEVMFQDESYDRRNEARSSVRCHVSASAESHPFSRSSSSNFPDARRMFRMSSTCSGPTKQCLVKPLPPIPHEDPSSDSQAVAAVKLDFPSCSVFPGTSSRASTQTEPYAITEAVKGNPMNIFGHYYLEVGDAAGDENALPVAERKMHEYAVLEPTTHETVDTTARKCSISPEPGSAYTLPNNPTSPTIPRRHMEENKRSELPSITHVPGPTERAACNDPDPDTPSRRKPVPLPRPKPTFSVTVLTDDVEEPSENGMPSQSDI